VDARRQGDKVVGGTTHQLALRRGRTTPDIVALSMLENRDHSVTEQESRCAAASTLTLMQGVSPPFCHTCLVVPATHKLPRNRADIKRQAGMERVCCWRCEPECSGEQTLKGPRLALTTERARGGGT